MHLLQTDFNNNPNIGLFAFCNDKFCLVCKGLNKKLLKKIEEVLKIPVHEITLCGTDLIGVFCAGNNECILVPDICFEYELKQLDRLKIKYKVIKTRLTALGNNILCNEKACIVNTEFSAVLKKEIRTALNIKLRPVKILRLEVPGAVAVMNKNGCVVHNGISDEELKYIKELFETKCSRASVNFGSPYIKSGLIANNNGFVVSNATSGIEVNDIDKALGFLQ